MTRRPLRSLERTLFVLERAAIWTLFEFSQSELKIRLRTDIGLVQEMLYQVAL